jgi:hypothetical protein
MLSQLSALTPPIVDHLYNIDGASPVDSPVFLFLVGAPGAGKSSGHAHAIESGILQAGNYATINLDILLESLVPFRAATAMAHYYGKTPFPTYSSNKENLGAFDWYDKDRDSIDPTGEFSCVRERFLPLKDKVAEHRITDINDVALARAINRHINIVYETTLHVASNGRVKKVDDIMSYLKKHPYRIVFYHITGSPIDIAARIHARQEYGMPQEAAPFYRYVPVKAEHVELLVRDTAAGFAAVSKRYGKKATFAEFTNVYDVMKAPQPNRRSRSTRKKAIMRAYGPGSDSNNSLRLSSSLYVSPTSSEYQRSETRSRRRI